MSTSLKPLGDNIWVQPLADDADTPYVDEQISMQGMLMVVTKQKAASRGYVKAIGPGKLDAKNRPIPMPRISLGDIVRWTQGSAHRLLVDGEKLYIVSAGALIGTEQGK